MNAATSTSSRPCANRSAWICLALLFIFVLGLCAIPVTAQGTKKEDTKKADDKKDDKKKDIPKKLDDPKLSLKGHKDWVNRVVYSSDGKQLASAGRDKTVKIWNAATGKEVLTIKDFPTNVKNVVFSPDNKRVLTTTGQWHKKEQQWIGEIRICDATNGKVVRTLKGHGETIESADVSRDGKYLATGSEDQTVKIWDLATGKDLHTLKVHRGPVRGVSFSADGTRLATAGDIIEIKKIEDKKKEDKKKKKDTKNDKKKDDVKKDDKKKDDKEKPGEGAEIKIWDTVSGKELATLKGPARSITCVVFSPDAKHVAAGSLDGTIRIWDVETGKEVQLLKGPEGVWGMAYSADGGKIASGGWDQTIRIWDATSGKELRSIYGHDKTVTSLAFSPDGQHLVSGAIDNTIKIWSVAGGQK